MRAAHYSRRGHTLLELTISVPLMVLLFMGLASAIHVARRSFPDGTSHTSATVLGASALDQLACEAAFATSIVSRTASSVTFVTPDRSSDSSPETISYQWSATAGAPLTRVVNGSAPETLVPSVQSFALTYDSQLDPASGQQHCRAVNAWMLLPAGGTARVEARIETLNEPVLP